jgi:hypothetical protein
MTAFTERPERDQHGLTPRSSDTAARENGAFATANRCLAVRIPLAVVGQRRSYRLCMVAPLSSEYHTEHGY